MRRLVNGQQSPSHLCSLAADRAGTIQAAADNPATKVLVKEAVHRRICRAGNAFDHIVRDERLTNTIAKHRDVEDHAASRQMRNALKNLFQSEFRKVIERQALRKRTELVSGI